MAAIKIYFSLKDQIELFSSIRIFACTVWFEIEEKKKKKSIWLFQHQPICLKDKWRLRIKLIEHLTLCEDKIETKWILAMWIKFDVILKQWPQHNECDWVYHRWNVQLIPQQCFRKWKFRNNNNNNKTPENW